MIERLTNPEVIIKQLQDLVEYAAEEVRFGYMTRPAEHQVRYVQMVQKDLNVYRAMLKAGVDYYSEDKKSKGFNGKTQA